MVRISQGLLHRGLGRRVGLPLFSNCGGAKNQGSGAYILKDGYRLSCKIQTHQRRFKASQRETIWPTRADTNMAHPMDSQQFREAAKAAIDDSKFLCFALWRQCFTCISFFLVCFVLWGLPSLSHRQSRISATHMKTLANLLRRCSELPLVLSQTMRSNVFVTVVIDIYNEEKERLSRDIELTYPQSPTTTTTSLTTELSLTSSRAI